MRLAPGSSSRTTSVADATTENGAGNPRDAARKRIVKLRLEHQQCGHRDPVAAGQVQRPVDEGRDAQWLRSAARRDGRPLDWSVRSARERHDRVADGRTSDVTAGIAHRSRAARPPATSIHRRCARRRGSARAVHRPPPTRQATARTPASASKISVRLGASRPCFDRVRDLHECQAGQSCESACRARPIVWNEPPLFGGELSQARANALGLLEQRLERPALRPVRANG